MVSFDPIPIIDKLQLSPDVKELIINWYYNELYQLKFTLRTFKTTFGKIIAWIKCNEKSRKYQWVVFSWMVNFKIKRMTCLK